MNPFGCKDFQDTERSADQGYLPQLRDFKLNLIHVYILSSALSSIYRGRMRLERSGQARSDHQTEWGVSTAGVMQKRPLMVAKGLAPLAIVFSASLVSQPR